MPDLHSDDSSRSPRTDTEHRQALVIHALRVRSDIVDHPARGREEAARLAEAWNRQQEWYPAAIVLNSLAYAHREALQHADALQTAAAALEAARRAGSAPEQVRALVVRAMIHLELGRTAAARADLAEAGPLTGADPDLTFATSVVALNTGQVVTAERLLRTLLADPQTPTTIRVKALNNLGFVLTPGRPADAVALFDEAVRLAAGLSRNLATIAAGNRGIALAHLGRVVEAVAVFEQTRRDLIALDGPVAEHDYEVGLVLGQLRLFAEARAAVRRALDGLTSAGGALVRADALLAAGRLAAADGDPVGALAHLDAARTLYAHQSRPYGVAVATVETARIHADRSAPVDLVGLQEAAATLERLGVHVEACRALLLVAEFALAGRDLATARTAWSRAAGLDGLAASALTLEATARAALIAGDRATATTAIGDALQIIDGRLQVVTAADLRHRVATDRARFEQLRLACAGAVAANGTGLDAAALLDRLLTGRPPPPAARASRDDSVQRAAWRQIAQRIMLGDEPPEALAMLQRELSSLERQLQVARWVAPGTATPTRPAGLHDTLARVRGPVVALLRSGTRVLGVRADPVGWPDPIAHNTALDLGDWQHLLTDLSDLGRGLARISGVTGVSRDRARRATRQVLSRVDDRLAPLFAGGVRVLVVDRGLDGAPWCALPSLWAADLSVASLAVTRRPTPSDTPRPDARPGVLIGCGPDLPAAPAEAAAVAQVWSGGARVQAVGAAHDLATGLGDADVVHIAAHAELRWDNPWQSRIRMADGPLVLADLVAGSRRLRLVHLSACSLGRAPADPEFCSAASMLAEQGVAEVVATTIPLADAVAPELALAVHTAVRDGLGAAAGLAGLRRRTDPADPGALDLWCALAASTVTVALP